MGQFRTAMGTGEVFWMPHLAQGDDYLQKKNRSIRMFQSWKLKTYLADNGLAARGAVAFWNRIDTLLAQIIL